MTEQPLVSILMTAYNREKYIAEAIESVLASTYKNFELIIVDDRSKDSTVEVANKYRQTDERIKVFVNPENLGDYPNRNRAASHATGKYLKYVDADDLIYPWGIELLVDSMEKFPEAGWGLCSLPQDQEQLFPFMLSPQEAYNYHYEGKGLFGKAPLSSIIRKDKFDETGGFDNIRMAGDFNMWHKLGQHYPVVLMPQGMVWYRRHSDQEMSHYKEYKMLYEEIRKRYLTADECPLNEAQKEGAIKMIRQKNKKQLVKSVLRMQGIGDALSKYRFWNKK